MILSGSRKIHHEKIRRWENLPLEKFTAGKIRRVENSPREIFAAGVSDYFKQKNNYNFFRLF